MDFLLECIGFPPDYPLDHIVGRVLRDGEPAAWRGDPRSHRRFVLGGGLEVRIDRESGDKSWNILPHCQVAHRLRVAVEEVRPIPDSPFDALLIGWADPPATPAQNGGARGAYRLCTYITDARRLPPRMRAGHVLAVSLAGFALDVTYVGPDEGAADPRVLERESAAMIQPLGAPDDPGGCADVSLRVRQISHFHNPITGIPVELVEAEAPGRPLPLFLSRWQLAKDGLEVPRPGWRVEGTFMFSGRVAGGLPRRSRPEHPNFG